MFRFDIDDDTVSYYDIGMNLTHKASYLYDTLANQAWTVDACIRVLRQKNFDAIAFTGISGALIAPAVAHAMGKQLIVVRKFDERCHSKHLAEGTLRPSRYVVIDDCISTGRTVEYILYTIDGEFRSRHVPVGIVLYNRPCWYEPDDPGLDPRVRSAFREVIHRAEYQGDFAEAQQQMAMAGAQGEFFHD